MKKQQLISLALVRIRDGDLPRSEISRMFAGSGHEEICSVCRQPITEEQIEYEVPQQLLRDQEVTLYFHFPCYEAWMQACRDSAAAGESPADGASR